MTTPMVTGEAVALDVQTAGLASRLLAGLIDGAVQGALFIGLILLITFTAGGSSGAAVAALMVMSYVLAGLVYPVLSETLWRGRTLGKLALGLRVVRDDAGPVAFRQVFVRGLLGFIVEKPGFTLGSAAVLTSLLHPSGKRLGDLAAGTVVVQERVVGPRGEVALMPPPLASWATSLDLSRLPDDLALAARTFLTRRTTMTPAAQEDLAQRLAGQVSTVVSPPPPPGTPAWAYLAAVLAERRQRAVARQVVAPPAPVSPPAPQQAEKQPPPPSEPPAAGGFALPF